MTASEILQESHVPGTDALFFLGCFSTRVTLYSQQVRALNLVDAILSDPELSAILSRHGRVAIIGGGAGGMTAAAAFAKSGRPLETIQIYERNPELLHLQLGCHDRYLHPLLYDWPRPGADRTDAELPLMTWKAGSAGSVALALREGFDSCRKYTSALRPVIPGKVTKIRPQEDGYEVQVDGKSMSEKPYDVVLLCIGFGYEVGVGIRDASDPRKRIRTTSYWDPFPICGPIKNPAPEHKIFISGNGDGGLADFVLSAFIYMSHEALCDFVMSHLNRHGTDAIKEVLLEIDRMAWQAPVGFELDIFREYDKRVRPLLLKNKLLVAEAARKLRPNVRIWFHTNERHLFKRGSAILNRLLFFLAIVADEEKQIHLYSNVKFDILPDEKIRIGDNEPFSVDYKFFRFGPDGRDNLEPFKEFSDKLSDVTKTPAEYPLTPKLNWAAFVRFAHPHYDLRRHTPPRGNYAPEIVSSITMVPGFKRFMWDEAQTYDGMERVLRSYDIAKISRDADRYGVDDDPFLMQVRLRAGEYLASVGRLPEGNEIYAHAKGKSDIVLERTQLENKHEIKTILAHQLYGHLDTHKAEIEAATAGFGKESLPVYKAKICSACRIIAAGFNKENRLQKRINYDIAEDLLNSMWTPVVLHASKSGPFVGCLYFLQRAKLCLRYAEIEWIHSGRIKHAEQALLFVNDGKRFLDETAALEGASVFSTYLLVCELMAKAYLWDASEPKLNELRRLVVKAVELLPRQVAMCHFTAQEMEKATGVRIGPRALLSDEGG
ncbi:hypothetical protein [Caballeronia sp. LZ032]|uniref:hypothetical protein n=1 Tax=Caballeronia sp. LZ032 TaxID=3038565 RepID=UPI00285BD1A5|nr:hypothetical protein [Caballeronia sp. LZ032]MDR5882512.1 hypothetical protein [Caballeronia sp. LZ032]